MRANPDHSERRSIFLLLLVLLLAVNSGNAVAQTSPHSSIAALQRRRVAW